MSVAIAHSAMNNLDLPSSLTKGLPEDLFLNFCSFLDPRDTESLTFTCKQHRSKISAITQLYHDELREVVNRTFKLLNLEAPDLSNFLRRSSLKTMNRTVSKFSAFFLRTFISNQQASIQIKTKSLPRYVLRSIETSKDVTRALMAPTEFHRDFALRGISEALTAQGRIEEAIEVAGRIPDALQRSLTLDHISRALTAQGRMEEAIEVAGRIPDARFSRSFALKHISEALTAQGRMEEAIEVAGRIPDAPLRSLTLKHISDSSSSSSSSCKR